MPSMQISRAVAAVERAGILLVFPQKDRADIPSLWSKLHPRTAMRWAWDEGADPRVAELWHVRGRLAQSRDVVYSKWFQGRATLFSRGVFASMLARLRDIGDVRSGLSPESMRVLSALREESPLGTKSLRGASGFLGKEWESAYNKALRPLWTRLLVVGGREVEEGGFPSLSVGATELLFEDLWESPVADDAQLDAVFARTPPFERAFRAATKDLATKLELGVKEAPLGVATPLPFHDIWGPRK